MVIPKLWPSIEKLDLQNAETRRLPRERIFTQD